MQNQFEQPDLSVIWKHETDSTNLDASRGRADYPDKTVWAADFQREGRGQRGNRWRSECAENLTFSILLKPASLPASMQFLLSEAASVAVIDYLSSAGVEARIKWPNDIYVGDSKICGMLLEHSISCDKVSASVIGIGINVMQTEFPSDCPNPTSMALCLPHRKTWDLKTELVRFLGFFYAIYDTLGDAGARDRLEERYLSLLYRRGEWHTFIEKSSDGRSDISGITGCITGVDKYTSRLILRLPDGSFRQYAFKEISYVI